jgi:hypothetical protein
LACNGVATFDSHWSCPVFLAGPPTQRPTVVVALREPPLTAVPTAELTSACSSRWIRPSFSLEPRSMRFHRSRPGMPRRTSQTGESSRPCIQRPNAANWSLFRLTLSEPVPARFVVPDPVFGADKASAREPQQPAEWLVQEPFLGTTGGTQTHSRRTDEKLGRLRYARQGLVRVSESNTKYGGKRGKTGGSRTPVIVPSISESSGIPKRKKSLLPVWISPHPAVHREHIFCPQDCVSKTHIK